MPPATLGQAFSLQAILIVHAFSLRSCPPFLSCTLAFKRYRTQACVKKIRRSIAVSETRLKGTRPGADAVEDGDPAAWFVEAGNVCAPPEAPILKTNIEGTGR